jgi:hypothetical protein
MLSPTDPKQMLTRLHDQILSAMLRETDLPSREEAMRSIARHSEESGLAMHSLTTDSPEAFLESLLLSNPSALTWVQRMHSQDLLPDPDQPLDLPDAIDLFG